MADKCDCKVYPYTPGGIYQGYELIYCPRHAAADALYEVAKDAVYLRHIVMVQRVALDTEINAIITLARKAQAALALADGDKGE